jgi:hypothetical protein
VVRAWPRGTYGRKIVREVVYSDEPQRCIGSCGGMTRRMLVGEFHTPTCELCEWKFLNPWFFLDEFEALHRRGDDDAPATVLSFRLSEAS